MQKVLAKSEKQNDLLKLFWVFALLFFLAIGFASHAAAPAGADAATAPKPESILLSAPNLHGKHFFTILINSPDPKQAPKNFRIFSSTGLETFPASVSAVLSKGQIEFLAAKLNSDSVAGTPGQAKQIHIVDTSSHAHGFVNNMQVVWLDQNVKFGTDDHAFVDSEKGLLAGLKKEKKVTLFTLPESVDDINISGEDVIKMGGEKIRVQADAVETEQQYLKTKKIAYTRIPIAVDDISKIEDKQIDQLSNLVKRAKKDEWLHFHNEGGDRSASLAVLLADILKNATNMSLNDILARENDMSAQVKLSPVGSSPQLEKIYAYAKEQGPDFKKSFSSWNKK